MTFLNSPSNPSSWEKQAHTYLLQGHYSKAETCYEEAIKAEPDVQEHYWYLGLALLLQGKEEEATTTWLLAMVEGESEQLELWTAQLAEILETEARRQEAREDYSQAWLIRGHIRELQPTNLGNLLALIQLAISRGLFTGEELTEWGAIELIQAHQSTELEIDELLQVLNAILQHPPLHPSAIEFTEVCAPHLQQHPDFMEVILTAAVELAYSGGQVTMALRLLEIGRHVQPSNLEILRHLAAIYQNGIDYAKGIALAKEIYSVVETLPEKIFANHLLLRGLMGAGGYWEEAACAIKHQESLISSLIGQEPTELAQATVARLITAGYFFPYFRDRARENRQIMNQLLERCQCYFQFQTYEVEQVKHYYQQGKNVKKINADEQGRRIKIGYLSHCFRSHSVGWLARWLFQYHDRQRFEVHAYMISNQDIGDPLNEWYINHVEFTQRMGSKNVEIAEKIYQDDIDILIDLDSITMDLACEVMALKPAPIQVTWLGWDASGLPTIDYFIADPYVLPESASDYYRENIWRLPQTYIGVDGFEVGVPTLRREDLNIPNDAAIYFSGQKGYKRHPDTARLQMKIIQAVPNSYFLIKGLADEASIKNFFIQLAEDEGVDPDRLRFLPPAPSEAIHRANLGIADVVLDTYPYNGATTTLETLWMGIPLVTRVGEQFAARNSYTMMMNVGVTEGIAWTDEEYVDWGIRLGKDAALRQEISWQLRRSRHTSPLWNGKEFTRQMEKSYQQMWQIYLQNQAS
ncbi:O-linked N-acetylglucosamine transferase, SPINDLY family protein [Phormidium sp. CCY1219]|uniref:O-linked N-acetylglucosamine transferase, SPINDLY family protein n=1 Tax=Phormidium sp. CCY1219 TaxID=2886104 RepID=UPI002D1EC032|nr:tetratricopeptide repeat protein [Phormidium sp. CCY1219]MEB3831392.1 tetratricopeptide repeat protein [Phormidium sp. CCY1219]